MKSLVSLSVPLLAAVLLLPQGLRPLHAQDVPSGQDSGSQPGADQWAEHSVRGDITAISGDNITVKTEQGEIYTIATGPNTRIRKQRDPVKITDLHVGDMVAAIGDKDLKAKTIGAVAVIVIDKEQFAKARADFGKTWTAGVVQSIDGTNIIVKRPDNVTQTIAVDENTSFRKRREDITLADIKPGDNVNARGALQNGSFLATVLTVGGPGGFGGGGGGAGAGYRSHQPPDTGGPQPNTSTPPQPNN